MWALSEMIDKAEEFIFIMVRTVSSPFSGLNFR